MRVGCLCSSPHPFDRHTDAHPVWRPVYTTWVRISSVTSACRQRRRSIRSKPMCSRSGRVCSGCRPACWWASAVRISLRTGWRYYEDSSRSRTDDRATPLRAFWGM